MNSLFYLIAMGLKNSLLEVLRKPAKLVMYLLVIGAMVGLIVLALFTEQSAESSADLIWLEGVLFLLISLFVVFSVQKGLADGGVIFDMSDVNLLFVSPVSPKSILIYGLVRMVKMVFLAGFFILYQTNNLSSSFGVGFGAVFLVLLGFMLAVSALSILSLVIYSAVNGNARRKRLAKLVTVAVFLPLLFCCVWQVVAEGDVMKGLESALRSPVFAWTPVAGWAARGTVALIAGSLGAGLLFYGLTAASGVLLALYVVFGKADYYEDVLVSTETAFETKRAAAEGQLASAQARGRRVKVAGTGLAGAGASTFFYRHLRESFRASRFGIFTLGSVFTVLGAVALSVFLRGTIGIEVILPILMWMQIMVIGTGRGLRELFTHYIYMVPDSSFSKIVWSNLELVLKVLLESVLIFVICGLILGENPLVAALCIVTYTLFSLLLIGINYLSMRWTTADISAGVLLLLYFVAVILIMLPGLAAGIIAMIFMEGTPGLIAMLGIISAWELIAALGCFALSRGVLDRCDIQNMPGKK